MVHEIKGDLLETECEVIAHGVNCQGVMGAGVAKSIANKWPEVEKVYKDFCEVYRSQPDLLLGEVLGARTDDGKLVLNCFTQQNYGKGGQIYLNYTALNNCLVGIREKLEIKQKMQGKRIDSLAMPKIGCGLAGGRWDFVRSIINKNLSLDVYVYEK